MTDSSERLHEEASKEMLVQEWDTAWIGGEDANTEPDTYYWANEAQTPFTGNVKCIHFNPLYKLRLPSLHSE